MNAIRAKLALWLVAALCAAMALVLGIGYVLVHDEIDRAFDAELALVAKAVHLREDWAKAGQLRIARPGFFFAIRAYDNTGRVYFETRLPEVPYETPLRFEQGYSSVDTPQGGWRLFTLTTAAGNVQVAQPLAKRDELAHELALRMLAPTLLLIPILAALVPWALARGLSPLRDISRKVSARDAALLDPLPTAGTPRELLPLIEQINALLGRLAASLDAQRAFLADAAHDLRSPIAALSLQAQIAERAPSGPARIAAFHELRRGIERAGRLVQQLLDFGRLEPGVRPHRPAALDIARLIREVIADHDVQADRLGVDLGADAPEEIWVAGVEPDLRSMLANVIDNALRYAPRDTEVTVFASSRDGVAEIRVVDAGPGIPESEREGVFDRFHRVQGDRKAGSGLGLSIVKAIVARHRGTIVLGDARAGRLRPGLSVSIHLPLARSARGAGLAPPPNAALPRPQARDAA